MSYQHNIHRLHYIFVKVPGIWVTENESNAKWYEENVYDISVVCRWRHYGRENLFHYYDCYLWRTCCENVSYLIIFWLILLWKKIMSVHYITMYYVIRMYYIIMKENIIYKACVTMVMRKWKYVKYVRCWCNDNENGTSI